MNAEPNNNPKVYDVYFGADVPQGRYIAEADFIASLRKSQSDAAAMLRICTRATFLCHDPEYSEHLEELRKALKDLGIDFRSQAAPGVALLTRHAEELAAAREEIQQAQAINEMRDLRIEELTTALQEWIEATSGPMPMHGPELTRICNARTKAYGALHPMEKKPAYPNDTDGDGNCGRPACPHCSPLMEKKGEQP